MVHVQALRLVVDHLQHLPGVRLVLSCTAAPAPEEEQQATGPAQGQRKQQEQPPWAASSAARSSTPTRGRPPATHSGPGSAPLFNTPYPVLPGEGADGGAGVGWDRAARGVVAALRQALRPVEVPLSLLRRDELLPLALAHVLQVRARLLTVAIHVLCNSGMHSPTSGKLPISCCCCA